ncbi:MAG: ATP-binding protein [Candidatus Hydrogenedentes bacterium]|nr:ATP-binding protein [Candidatus Hydrogenedentota bacterium]
MKTITVQVREDHLETVARTKPMTAIAELIWNALDAEATEVNVSFQMNELDGLEAIHIIDNGTGLHYDDGILVFQSLGGSWKRPNGRTHELRRELHGKYGKGRFRAFTLGQRVTWHSIYAEAGDRYKFSISGAAGRLGEFQVSNPKGAPESHTGMTVEMLDPPLECGVLLGVKALQEITDIFALYLRQYPGVRITYDNTVIDPANAEHGFARYTLDEMVMQNGERVTAELEVVEWNLPGKRGVYLCDEHGFMRHNALPRLHFRGFSYSAYIKSSHVTVLDREGLLQAGDLAPDVRQLLDAARTQLREHFALQEARRAQDTLARWREDQIYPFAGEARDEQEANERRIFDIYATHLHQIFPDFSGASLRSKRLTLSLLKELVASEPTRVARVLDQVLEFPEEKEEAILELIAR